MGLGPHSGSPSPSPKALAAWRRAQVRATTSAPPAEGHRATGQSHLHTDLREHGDGFQVVRKRDRRAVPQ
jgi:hypothetical protein